MSKELASKILRAFEDDNEFHFHQVDRDFIIQAMIKYNKVVKSEYISGVSVPKGTLPYDPKCDDACKFYCTKGNTQYPECLK